MRKNEKVLCVGGPCHGKYVNGNMPDFMRATMPSWQRTDWFNDAPTADMAKMYTENYRYMPIMAKSYSLEMHGYVFAWAELNEEEMVRAAWGLMLSENIAGFNERPVPLDQKRIGAY